MPEASSALDRRQKRLAEAVARLHRAVERRLSRRPTLVEVLVVNVVNSNKLTVLLGGVSGLFRVRNTHRKTHSRSAEGP